MFRKQTMKLSQMTPKRLKEVVLAITPDVKPITESLKKIVQIQKEAAQSGYNAANEQAKLITEDPAIPKAVQAELQLYVRQSLATAANAGSTDGGLAIFDQIIQTVFVDCYQNIINILAVLNDVSVEEIEQKTILDIQNMVFEILQDKMLVNFFPQLGQLAKNIR